MASDKTDEQALKKGRHRKKQLYNSILQQMEFYFSDSNLSKDRFLSGRVKENPYVDLTVFLNFNKIRKLTTNIQDIQKALNKSELLQLSEDQTQVYRKTPVKLRTNADECMIYVEHIKSDTTHEWLSNAFSQFGKVVYVSLPKYAHNNINKGFAFVEFENEGGVESAVKYFESIGNILQLPPEELCSIKVFDGKSGEGGNEKEEGEGKKRKRSEDNVQENAEKKVKQAKDEDEWDATETEGKKKVKKNKKKCQLKEMGLQILTKKDWKQLRNKYLNIQREKMKQLKLHLYQTRFAQQGYDEHSQDGLPKTEEKPHEEPQQKLEFVPNVIVKVKLREPAGEQKKIKAELNGLSPKIKFIDVQIGSETIYVRFSDEESARNFLTLKYNGECTLLEGDEETEYWDKIQRDREVKFTKGQKKQRGRDKLLKKAEKQLGKHIIFDDVD